MFGLFRKKQDKAHQFDVYNESTWNMASDSIFTINNKIVKTCREIDVFSEKELVKAIEDVIYGICSYEETRPQIRKLGRDKAIERLLDDLSKGLEFYDSIDEMVRWLNSDGKKPPVIPFDILNFDTWDDASYSKEMVWNGKVLPDKDGNPATEERVVNLARTIFNFLERNEEIIPQDRKIEMLKNILNRMENPAYYAEEDKKRQEEQDTKRPDGLFNPRNPDTYKYAKSKKSLIIDGIHIFDTYIVSEDYEKKEVKKDITEKGFVDLVSSLIRINERMLAWETALASVKQDFEDQGIECPNQETPGYFDRVNEVYNSIMKNQNTQLTKKQEKEYIDKYISQIVARCSPQKLSNYGGYGFSETQIEVLDGLSIEKIEKIGEIMASGESNRKQKIWNSLGIDGYWVVRLDNCYEDPDLEEKIMHDFYLGYEFSSKKALKDFLNSRPYLKKHPELKDEIIRIRLEYADEE